MLGKELIFHMVYSENAKVIEAEELKEIIDEQTVNPTIDRLMFIEAKAMGSNETKIFPCYLVAWGEEENSKVKTDPGLRFKINIVQCLDGDFSMVQVIVLAKELGVTKRIWDKPPTKGRREYLPFAEASDKIQ